MKAIIKLIVVLTSVCMICAFSLALVFSIAEEKIAINAKKKENEAILKLVPLAKKIEVIKVQDEVIYKLFDDKNNFINYAFIALGDGYQGKIKILTILNPSLENLEGIEIIESVETPGLGARIKEDFFKEQFKKLKVSPLIEYVKEKMKKENQITAITGATISSKSVVNILNNRIKELKPKLQGIAK